MPFSVQIDGLLYVIRLNRQNLTTEDHFYAKKIDSTRTWSAVFLFWWFTFSKQAMSASLWGIPFLAMRATYDVQIRAVVGCFWYFILSCNWRYPHIKLEDLPGCADPTGSVGGHIECKDTILFSYLQIFQANKVKKMPFSDKVVIQHASSDKTRHRKIFYR